MLKSNESLSEFYREKFGSIPESHLQNTAKFNVFKIEDTLRSENKPPAYRRRDFYKIMLFQGDNIFHFADESISVSGNTLLFFNPQIPYTSEPLTNDTKGFFCVFNEDFLNMYLRLNMRELPLFNLTSYPVFSLSQNFYDEVKSIFEKIYKEMYGDFSYKYELMTNYVSELIYMALKLQPSTQKFKHPDASARLTSIFLELLERQFPIESTSQRFEFRLPKTIAEKLSVHVNYLNRAIKKATGKTTTEHIAERVIGEAKALLNHTDWNISEISFALGFENQAQFNNFFKKYTALNPTSYRNKKV